MEKHACKLCFKRFPTGRALGGHMRCHAAASDEAPPPPSKGWMQSYRLRENPRKSVRLADAHFSSPFADSAFDAALDDSSYSIDSDAESHPTPEFHRRRSKRRRRSLPEAAPAAEPPEPVSSLSDVTTEEDVAISLVLLSREAWIMEEAEQNELIAVSDDHSAEAVEQIVAFDHSVEVIEQIVAFDHSVEVIEQIVSFDHSAEDNQIVAGSMPDPTESPQAVRCENCRKEFSSCQALGSHRASFKKRNVSCAAADAILVNVNPDIQHECGICSRVFSSGQALGGHKRAHLCTSSVAPPSPTLRPRAAFLFDLNRPPPGDAAEPSAVSGDNDGFGN